MQVNLFIHQPTDISPVQLIYQEEVLRTILLQHNIIDFVKIWHLVIDNVAMVVSLAQDVVTRVEEHFYAVAHFDL